MDLSSGMFLEQRQQLSQNQIQSLEILAMDSMELSRFLQDEYLENPLMDCSGEHSVENRAEDPEKSYDLPTASECDYSDTSEETDGRRKDIPALEIKSLKQYIIEQVGNDCHRDLVEYLTECLDEAGFFGIPVSEVSEKTGYSEAEVTGTLDMLRELEPYGIFAADIRQCLMKQLEAQGQGDTAAYRIVQDYLQEVADGRISSISRGMKISTAEVRKCLEQISRLNPRPAAEFGQQHTDYIVPDILFRKENDDWEIELNDGWVEDYHVNDYYLKMMKEVTDPELKEYFRRKLERTRFVMNSIEQRRTTMLSISQEILKHQEAYLDGTGYLQPMTMTLVAGEIGIHTSTVSRAIRGKYIQCPAGTVLMKKLFSTAVSDNEGVNVGASQIKEALKELIHNEDKRKPASDQTLAKLLTERGMKISRRAVAKYREELGIRGSFDRKEL